MSPQEEVIRGERAKQLLADPLLNEAFEHCKTEVLDAWEKTPARDVEAREWLWKLYHATLKAENMLRGYVDTGKFADFNLKQSVKDKVLNAFRSA
jgi:hypothetical protein